MHVVHNDGTEGDITAGTGYEIEPGHDAWVVGDDAGRRLRVRQHDRADVRSPFLDRDGIRDGARVQRTAARVKVRMAIVVSRPANAATTARLSTAISGRVRHAPDVVQAARVAEQAVAHERERVREREHPGEAGEEPRQRGDREQRTREEERHDRQRRQTRR